MAKNCIPMHKEYATTGKLTETNKYYPTGKNTDTGKQPEGQKSHNSNSGGK